MFNCTSTFCTEHFVQTANLPVYVTWHVKACSLRYDVIHYYTIIFTDYLKRVETSVSVKVTTRGNSLKQKVFVWTDVLLRLVHFRIYKDIYL